MSARDSAIFQVLSFRASSAAWGSSSPDAVDSAGVTGRAYSFCDAGAIADATESTAASSVAFVMFFPGATAAVRFADCGDVGGLGYESAGDNSTAAHSDSDMMSRWRKLTLSPLFHEDKRSNHPAQLARRFKPSMEKRGETPRVQLPSQPLTSGAYKRASLAGGRQRQRTLHASHARVFSASFPSQFLFFGETTIRRELSALLLHPLTSIGRKLCLWRRSRPPGLYTESKSLLLLWFYVRSAGGINLDVRLNSLDGNRIPGNFMNCPIVHPCFPSTADRRYTNGGGATNTKLQ